MEGFNWCNDFRFVIMIISLIYHIYLYYNYVKPIDESSLDLKNAVREVSLKKIRPVVDNKAKKIILDYIKEADGFLNEYSMGRVVKEISSKLTKETANSINDEIEFDSLPKPT